MRKKVLWSLLVMTVIIISMTPSAWASAINWTTKTPMLTERYCSGIVNVDDNIYVLGGGQHNGTYVKAVEEYNTVSDTWTAKADMPVGRGRLGTAVVDGKVYAVGGTEYNRSTPTNKMEIYDIASNTWVAGKSMPTARLELGVVALDGKIYAIGGDTNGSTPVNVVEEYDPSTDQWTTKAPLNIPRRYFSTVVLNGKIYVIGGINQEGILDSVEEYDPVTNSWIVKASLNTPRYAFSATIINNRIYAIGGVRETIIPYRTIDDVEVYDPLKNSWVVAGPTTNARWSYSAISVRGKSYVIGGYNGSETLKTVEEMITEQVLPITTINISGTSGKNDWYVSDVQVTLTANDGDGSGVAETVYSLNGNEWFKYTSPFVISTEEVTQLRYKSTDNVGNSEIEKITEIKIDKTKPVIYLKAPDEGTQFSLVGPISAEWTASDNVSGIAEGPIYTPGSPWNLITSGQRSFTIYAEDKAGNKSTCSVNLSWTLQ